MSLKESDAGKSRMRGGYRKHELFDSLSFVSEGV